MTTLGRMAFKVKFLTEMTTRIDGELTNEMVKEGLNHRFLVPRGEFDYLEMLDSLDEYSDFDNHVTDCLDAAIYQEEAGNFLETINYKDISLADFKQTPFFQASIDLLTDELYAAGYNMSDTDVLSLYDTQPGFSEVTYLTCVGANDPELCMMFLRAIANALP